jgi:predicted permease
MYSFLDLSDTQVLYCSVHSSPCLIFELTKGVMRGSIISGLSNQLCQCCCYAPTRMMMSWISQAAQAFCADSDNGHLQALQCARVLPVDPIFNLTVLAEAAMPSAQNLVLLSQLRASTQPLAGMLANLLLSQYALSVVPITLWMAVFLTLVRGS